MAEILTPENAERSRVQTMPDYGIPTDEEGMLTWDWVLERLQKAKNYWICSIRPDGLPHVVPTWGVVVDGKVYHGGGPGTKRHRNLVENPNVVIHLESGDEVVILEGTVILHDETNIDPDFLQRADDEYEKKYNMRHGVPFWELIPKKAFAWAKYPTTCTRWVFEL